MSNRKHTYGARHVNITQEPMPADIRSAGASHEMNRERAVMNVLLTIYVLTGVQAIGPSDQITATGAKYQHISGKRSEGTNAAHGSPRQIMIAGQTLQEIAEGRNPGSDSFGFLLDTFGGTDTLPVNYNKADSLAESSGLVNAFLVACRLAVSRAGLRRRYFRTSLRPDVAACYELYKSRALGAFDVAIDKLQNDLASITIMSKRDNISEQINILRQYKSTLKASSCHPDDHMLIDIEGTLKDYS